MGNYGFTTTDKLKVKSVKDVLLPRSDFKNSDSTVIVFCV